MEIRYYENDEEMSFDASPRLLTSDLRSKIIGLDIRTQKEIRDVGKETDTNTISQDELSKIRQELRNENPQMSEKELNDLVLAEITNKLITVSDEEFGKREEKMKKMWGQIDKSNREFFLLVLNKKKLSEDILKKIQSDIDSEFWGNVIWEDIKEFNNSFRTKEKI